MSNKSYDADYTTASSEQDLAKTREHLLQQEEILMSRSSKHRTTERAETPAEVEAVPPTERKKAPFWARALFWLLRKSIAPIIMIVMLLAGLYIGYVIVGGQPKEDVFEIGTWKHMWDLIFAES